MAVGVAPLSTLQLGDCSTLQTSGIGAICASVIDVNVLGGQLGSLSSPGTFSVGDRIRLCVSWDGSALLFYNGQLREHRVIAAPGVQPLVMVVQLGSLVSAVEFVVDASPMSFLAAAFHIRRDPFEFAPVLLDLDVVSRVGCLS